MDAADRTGFYRGLGLALVPLGSFVSLGNILRIFNIN